MKKNLVLRTILIVTLGMFLLVGCGKAAVTSEAKPEETTEVVEEPAQEEPTVEVAEEPEVEETPEKVEEVAEEPSEDPEREIVNEFEENGKNVVVSLQNVVTEDDKAMQSYVDTLDVTNPTLIAWNSNTATAEILEGEEYQYKDGDRFIVAYSAKDDPSIGFAFIKVAEVKNYRFKGDIYFVEEVFNEGEQSTQFTVYRDDERYTCKINF